MGWKRTFDRKWTWLSVVWLAITLSLVGWWWFHAVQQEGASDRVRRMFFWEGSFLFGILFLGGLGLVYLTFQHQRRHERLKMFFSTFAHDLKTSITRLRLQSEILEESALGKDPKIAAILKDIQRLDLQLENSLWMAQLESNALLLQETALSEVMEHLRNEFADVRFDLSRDAKIVVDRRAFVVVLRNLFHNSVLHARADRIDINVKAVTSKKIVLEIGDNGRSAPAPMLHLGRDMLSSGSARGNGVGLYLSRRLMERMNGGLEFKTGDRFVNVLSLRGAGA